MLEFEAKDGYSYLRSDRLSASHGGVAVIHRANLSGTMPIQLERHMGRFD
jgi:hypothetical protein